MRWAEFSIVQHTAECPMDGSPHSCKILSLRSAFCKLWLDKAIMVQSQVDSGATCVCACFISIAEDILTAR